MAEQVNKAYNDWFGSDRDEPLWGGSLDEREVPLWGDKNSSLPSFSESLPDLGFGGELYTKDLKGIDFSEGFKDFDVAASFGAAAPSASRPAPGPPIAPSNGDYIFDNDATSIRSQFSKNLFGGNLDVITALESIVFDPGVDGSLRNSIAYIQPWTRAATSSKTEASASPDSVPVDTSLSDAMSGIWNNLDILDNPDLPSIDFALLENADTKFVPSFNSDSGIWEQTDYNYYTDTDFSGFSDFKGKLSTSGLYDRFLQDEDNSNNAATSKSDAEKKQTNLKKDTAVGFRPAGLLQGLFNPQGGGLNVGTIGKALTGPVFAGNPSGNILNQVGSLLNSFGVGSNTSRDLSSKQPKSSSLSIAPIPASSGKWQFLFNPSQLALSVGPNFKAAETWGVGDEPNAGQPLHWTSMKNPELKFSKVLLNGYVFGRRVEELEQGLIKLFMENPTNDAKHGPKVLEFVWGKKTFGPCVIKDIRINQKMWDEGLLVNAEVDFTLVRVPEWTINDGYVSTYDASAQNTIIEPKGAPKTSPNAGAGSDPPDASDKTQPPAKESIAEKLGLPEVKYAYTQSECDSGRYTAKNFSTLSNDPRINPNGWQMAFGSSEAAATVAINKYITIYNSFATVVNTLPGLDPICKAKCNYRGQAFTPANKRIGCAQSCATQISTILNNRYSGENKCPNPTLLAG